MKFLRGQRQGEGFYSRAVWQVINGIVNFVPYSDVGAPSGKIGARVRPDAGRVLFAPRMIGLVHLVPLVSAVPVVLTASERHRLKKMAYGHKTPYQTRQRATIVLLAARRYSNARIATQARMHVDTVRRWRGRFAAGGLPALADRKRSGRPVSFTPLQVAEVKALACQLPSETGAPLSRWSCPELVRELAARGITGPVSASTVRRWLAEDALKPWQHRSWIFITDPGFRPRAQRVLDLYARTWQGTPLGEDEYGRCHVVGCAGV